MCVALVERVELAEGHRQTDRQRYAGRESGPGTEREVLAESGTGPSDERSYVTLQAVTLQATLAGSGRLIHGLHSPWIH